MLGTKKITDAATELRGDLTEAADDLRRTLAIISILSVTALLIAVVALTAANGTEPRD